MGPGPARDAALTRYARTLIRTKARQLCRHPGFSRSDIEDVSQELILSLLAKAHLFDPKRASLDTFADRVVNSSAKMILRGRRRLKRAAGFKTISLDSGTVQMNGKPVPVAETIDTDHRSGRTVEPPSEVLRENDEAVAQALAELTPHLADIAERLKNVSVAGLAREMGVSRRQLYSALRLIRARFEATGFDKS